MYKLFIYDGLKQAGSFLFMFNEELEMKGYISKFERDGLRVELVVIIKNHHDYLKNY